MTNAKYGTIPSGGPEGQTLERVVRMFWAILLAEDASYVVGANAGAYVFLKILKQAKVPKDQAVAAFADLWDAMAISPDNSNVIVDVSSTPGKASN